MGVVRGKLIGLRVNKKEYDAILKEAKKSNFVSAAGYVRMCVFKSMDDGLNRKESEPVRLA